MQKEVCQSNNKKRSPLQLMDKRQRSTDKIMMYSNGCGVSG